MNFNTNDGGIILNKAVETFKKSIPFKVYCLKNDKISGTTEHTHDYMQIWYVMSGSCEHFINSTGYCLTKGNLFVLPPFVTHKVKISNSEDITIIGCEFSSGFINENISMPELSNSLFDFAYLEPFLVSHEAVKPRLRIEGKKQLKVEELFLDMLSEYEREEKYYEINIKADLLKLLALIAREYENKSLPSSHELFERYREAVSSAIRYIDNNFTNTIYIEEVCKIAMMSQTYFSYIFKQITGKTFVEYLNTLRIAKARELLNTCNLTITEICLGVGFNDAAYFNKVFKKEVGLSPSQYRKLK